jgi:hypothetical protein
MNLGSTIVDIAERVLPLDTARSAALPPVRAARMGAVAVARTVRHWELALGGDAEEEDGHVAPAPAPTVTPDAGAPSAMTDHAAPEGRPDDAEPIDGTELSGSELPVQGWAELSFADAQSALAACEPDDLRTLLAYEQAHGHRPQFTLLLEHRLADGGGGE